MTELPYDFVPLPNELIDALTRFDFTKRQYKVLLAVMRKTYGWHKKADDISSTQLAELTGLADTHCRATVRELVALGVLRSEPGRFGQVLALTTDSDRWGEDQNGPDRNSPGRRTETVRAPGPKQSGEGDQNGPHKRHSPKDKSKRHPPPQEREASSPPSPLSTPSSVGGGGEDLIFPMGMNRAERGQAATIVAGCNGHAQDVLDELAGLMKAGAIRVSPLACLRGLVKREQEGTFSLEAGQGVKQARKATAQRQAREERDANEWPEGLPRPTDEEVQAMRDRFKGKTKSASP